MGVFWFITGILVLSIISEWFHSKAVCVEEGRTIPDFRVWQLVHITDPHGEVLDTVFFLKLPSYSWEHDWSGPLRPQDSFDGMWCWHQRSLRYSAMGWRIVLFPCRT